MEYCIPQILALYLFRELFFFFFFPWIYDLGEHHIPDFLFWTDMPSILGLFQSFRRESVLQTHGLAQHFDYICSRMTCKSWNEMALQSDCSLSARRQQRKACRQPKIYLEQWDLKGEQASLRHGFPVIVSYTAKIISFL